jgi:hypothetical protein
VTESTYEPVIAAHEGAGVRYVVVGGLAVVLHGHPRFTADLDLAIDLSSDEAARAVDVLGTLGLRPRVPVDPAGLADPAVRATWIESKGMTVLSFWDPDRPLRVVDVFVENPISFGELRERAETLTLGAIPVRIASIPDLIRMKELADRPQDRADIAALNEIERRRGTT